jgi:hypothetical protein
MTRRRTRWILLGPADNERWRSALVRIAVLSAPLPIAIAAFNLARGYRLEAVLAGLLVYAIVFAVALQSTRAMIRPQNEASAGAYGAMVKRRGLRGYARIAGIFGITFVVSVTFWSYVAPGFIQMVGTPVVLTWATEWAIERRAGSAP